MASKIRRQTHFIEELPNNVIAFEFHQLVRLINRFLQAETGELKFHVVPSLAFPAAELTKLEINKVENGTHKIHLYVNFLGLIGQSGALPENYTELLLERVQVKDKTLLVFLDLFHNKLLHLFYQASSLSRFYLAHEASQSHPIMDMLGALAGQHTAAFAEPLLYYSGLLSMQPRSAEGLRLILQSYFQLKVTIKQFSAEWVKLEKEGIAHLSRRSGNNHLNQDITLGKRFWCIQNKFTILIGPLEYSIFKRLLPGGDMLPVLQQMIRMYVGLKYRYVIELQINSNALPAARLTKTQSVKLGWGVLLKYKKPRQNIISITLPEHKEAVVY